MPAVYSQEAGEIGVLQQKHHQLADTKSAAAAAEAKFYQMQAGLQTPQQYMNPAAYFQQIQHQHQAMYGGAHLHHKESYKEATEIQQHQHMAYNKMAAMAANQSPNKDGRCPRSTSSEDNVVKVEPKVNKNIVLSGTEGLSEGSTASWNSGAPSSNPQHHNHPYTAGGAAQPVPAHSKHMAANPYHPYAQFGYPNSYGQFGYPVSGYPNQQGTGAAAGNYGGSYTGYASTPIKEERQTEGNVTPTIRDMETERAGRRARRNRTCFTKQQMDRLEELLNENRYPDVYRREEIAKELDLKEEVIRVWFKNRRAKAKRDAKDRRFMYQASANAAATTNWSHISQQQNAAATTLQHSAGSSTNPSPGSVYNSECTSKSESPVTPNDYYQAAFNHIAPSSSAEATALLHGNQHVTSPGNSVVVPPSIGDGMQYMIAPSAHSTDFSREVTGSPSEESQSFMSDDISQENCSAFSDAGHTFQTFAT